MGAERRGSRLRGGSIAVEQNEPGALGFEHLRRGEAEPGPSPGDQNPATA